MKSSLVLILCLISTVCNAQRKLNFEKVAPMVNEAYGFAYAASDKDIFALTGGDDATEYSNFLQVYDTRVDHWKAITVDNLPAMNYSSALYMEEFNGLLLLGGTQPYGSNIALVEKARMVNLKDYSVKELGTIPKAARNMGLAKDSTTVYMFGGSTKAMSILICSNKFYSYNLTSGHVEALPDLPAAMETNGAIVGRNLYVFGGYNADPLSGIWKYNIDEQEWTSLPSLLRPLSSYAIAQYEHYIFLIGDHIYTNQLIVYDTKKERYKYYRMNFRGRNLGAAVSGEFLYVYGGISPPPDSYIKHETYRINLSELIRK